MPHDLLSHARQRRVTLRLACAAFALAAFSHATQAQEWPNRPVRIVVPYPAGGAVDIVTRALADKLSSQWDQPVVIENKAGAGGLIGSDAVSKSAPDGYTLVMGTVGSHAIAPAVCRKMPYDAAADFGAVSLVALTPCIITVKPEVPARSLRARLAADTAKAAATPDFLARMDDLGFQARTSTPAEFDAYLLSEQTNWAKVVKDAGVPQE
jgi:tripartite-type tricarboxylate transporter receptor subunit TctC